MGACIYIIINLNINFIELTKLFDFIYTFYLELFIYQIAKLIEEFNYRGGNNLIKSVE